MTATLRIELFVECLDAFADFYVRVLGFEIADDRRDGSDGYVSVRRGAVKVGAVRSWTVVDRDRRSVPTGTELVLEVDDLAAEYSRVLDTGWDVEGPMSTRPWGLRDFRLHDPDGYYWRITARV